ncbi:MAG TPA: hypothetical protein VFS21_19585 [Roseiflexaceae bacterium]|nr:hypothetical protein [Roseiflexaceae bacterium]
MVIYGYIHRLGDGVTAEQIIAPEWREEDPAALAAHCLEAVDPQLPERVRPGDLLLAGRGFGAGEGQETAVLALQAAGFVALVCADADPDFVGQAAVYGLPVLIAAEAVAGLPAGALARLDLARGTLADRESGAAFPVPVPPPAVLDAFRRALLLNRMRQVVEEEGFDG